MNLRKWLELHRDWLESHIGYKIENYDKGKFSIFDIKLQKHKELSQKELKNYLISKSNDKKQVELKNVTLDPKAISLWNVTTDLESLFYNNGVCLLCDDEIEESKIVQHNAVLHRISTQITS